MMNGLGTEGKSANKLMNGIEWVLQKKSANGLMNGLCFTETRTITVEPSAA